VKNRERAFEQNFTLLINLAVILAFATTSPPLGTRKSNMADTEATTQLPSTSGTYMYVNTTELPALQNPMATEVSDCFRVVCLSGPIKILVPISAREETEDCGSDSRNLHLDASISPKVNTNAIDNNNTETVQANHPVDTRGPVEEVGDVTLTDTASNTQTTKPVSSLKGKIPTAVKQPDCKHPEETVSPL
jgi:hypothetical protein